MLDDFPKPPTVFNNTPSFKKKKYLHYLLQEKNQVLKE